jgi:hypothetical protein
MGDFNVLSTIYNIFRIFPCNDGCSCCVFSDPTMISVFSVHFTPYVVFFHVTVVVFVVFSVFPQLNSVFLVHPTTYDDVYYVTVVKIVVVFQWNHHDFTIFVVLYNPFYGF